MICNKCGNTLHPEQKFCNKCGNSIENVNGQGNALPVQNNTFTNTYIAQQPTQQMNFYNQNTNNINSQQTVQTNPFANINQPYNNNIQQSNQNLNGGPNPFFQQQQPMQQNYNQQDSYNQINSYNQPQFNQAPSYNMVPQNSQKGNNIHEPNKPLLITVGIVAIILLIGLVTVLLSPSIDKNLNKEEGTRTVMVYMIGSDLESLDGSATFDINEMLTADIDEEAVNVVLYTGGTKRWYTSQISEDENAIYEVIDGELIKRKTFAKEIMTKSNPLIDFLDYVYENYETDLYDLILWDHGGGPIYGYGYDENSTTNQAMSLDTLSKALSKTKLLKNTKLDFIGFDACLMGSVEVAYALKDQANYLIASEELEPGAGWNYMFLEDIEITTPTKEIGENIINEFFQYYESYNYKGNLTLSLIDLKEIEGLVSEIDALFSKTDGDINVNTFSEYARKLTRKTVYGNTGRSNSIYDLVDLKDLTNSISDKYPQETAAVNSMLEQVIIYTKDNMTNTNGLSIYFPTNNKKNIDTILTRYNNVKISNEYYNFLKKYSSFINGDRLVDRSLYKSSNPTYFGNSVSITLPEDLVKNYSKSDYIIFRKLGENNYMPVYKSSNLTLDGNVLSTIPSNQQLIVENTDGTEPGWATMYEVAREENYTDYNIAAILEKYDESLETPLQLRNVNLIYRVKKGEMQGEIIDAQLMSTTEVANKTSINIDDWQKIHFFSASYKLYDDSNNYLDVWESNKDYYINIFDIKEGFNVKFVGLDYDLSSIEIIDFDGTIIPNTNYEYYYMFRVSDTQGEIHQMNLVKAN